MNTALDNEIKLQLLNLLKEDPELTQREMNRQMKVSLGKINYCISALVEKGMIRVERFKKHKNKSAYVYRLTPRGFEELASLTLSFLKIRIREYDQIKMEIKSLSEQIDEIDLINNPDLIEELKNIS